MHKKVTQQHAAQKEKLKEMQKEQNSVPKKRCKTVGDISA